MKSKIKNITIKYAIMPLVVASATFTGCEKYLNDTQLPADKVAAADVYLTDGTTSTAVTGIFLSFTISGAFNPSSGNNIGFTTGLYADELKALTPGNFADVFYKNAIQTGQSPFWADFYKKIFVCNTAIAGINNSKGILQFKDQWLGECYFLRALCYYNLVNFYGDVPLALTDDYNVNNVLARAPQEEVFRQIIADLKQAQALLSTDYRNGLGLTTINRLRPNKAAATALLARAYLYAKDWANAEAAASLVIGDVNYKLLPLAQVFLANSQEQIWALAYNTSRVSAEYGFYTNGMPATLAPPSAPNASPYNIFAAINTPLLNAFEAGDGRITNWLRTTTVTSVPAVTYYFPNKYKSAVAGAENEVMLRLGEQYLIRAEARAMQNKATAVDDINAIRTRAGGISLLPATIPQATLLAAIAKERQTELFTESAHRFFDLKRTGKIDEVMTSINGLKGITWAGYMALWPIPPADIIQNPNIKPNPGYLQ
ncbi:hypothetical protein HDC92_000586 [Pedobacter sp. AK017]|uniref:RagB/SusD family nutrient uptake outer membrane protein n=1 Tax=Pedobacter sp. AK017 TaxID=2723073 RepID=UPI001620F3CE|nr:RagB/SusD family nutrient uptake outer membrane protein [Pedobacter sp. AK017]MBB5436922.1 hypothetical protein [Pedobacter sp. AK017]